LPGNTALRSQYEKWLAGQIDAIVRRFGELKDQGGEITQAVREGLVGPEPIVPGFRFAAGACGVRFVGRADLGLIVERERGQIELSAGGATFGGAAFRTAGNTLTLGGEWRSEQSRDNSYSESLPHLHHFSFLSKASQTPSPPVSSIAGQAGNSLPRGLNHSSNGVTMLAKFAER